MPDYTDIGDKTNVNQRSTKLNFRTHHPFRYLEPEIVQLGPRSKPKLWPKAEH